MKDYKLLKPLPSQPPPKKREFPRCEADTTWQGSYAEKWREERYGENKIKPFQCSRPSVVKIKGKNYCRLHAGHTLLDLLVEGKLTFEDTVG